MSEHHTDIIDEGGARALRGFNFQTAIGALIAVLNYSAEDFRLIVEGKEDLEVYKQDTHTYIQVKSSKLTTKKILQCGRAKQTGERRLAILYKLLEKGSSGDRYKLVVSNKFDQSKFMEEFQICSNNFLLDDVYVPTDATLEMIKSHLEKDKIIVPEEKLAKIFFYRAPFDVNFKTAATYICGVMAEQGISVDAGYGRIAISELVRMIYQKGECSSEEGIEKKTISAEDLRRIFKTSTRKEIEKAILEQLFPNQILQRTIIAREIFKIPFHYRYIKNEIQSCLKGRQFTPSMSEVLFINSCMQALAGYQKVTEIVKYAIVLDLMLDTFEESL